MQTDKELVIYALQLWANYIETGDINLSRRDVRSQLDAVPNKPSHAREREELNTMLARVAGLSDEQQEQVQHLRKMAMGQFLVIDLPRYTVQDGKIRVDSGGMWVQVDDLRKAGISVQKARS